MTWVMLSLRKMQLTARVSQLQTKQMEISQRIIDLQNYGSSIADGVVTPGEMGNCPSSVFGTQMAFLAASAPVAYQSAQIKTNAYLQQMGLLQQSTNGQYEYATDPTGANQAQPYLIFNEIYKQELQEYSKQITQQLDAEERQLEQEKLRISTQIKAAEAELEAVSKQEDANIKSGAIQLA